MKIREEYKKSNNFGLDYILPAGKDWFSPKEVSKILGCSDQYVRNCIYSGKIFAHVASKDAELGVDNKSYIRVHKEAIELYLLETANYTNEIFLERIKDILSRRSSYELMRIEKILKEMLYDATKANVVGENRY